MRVEVKNMTRVFGDLVAVNDANFSFGAGEVFGFIGPNGAGKTTTLRILATLDVPSEGDALIDGKSVVNYPDHARQVMSFMPDSLDAYRDVTVTEYIDFFARAYGLRGHDRKARISQVMDFTALDGLKDKLTDSLSKGMKQRLSLARTLINDPKVMLLDEPAAGLDPRARVELRQLIRTLGEMGKAILVSSHILTELSEMCDGVVIIEKGEILEAGKVCDVERTQSNRTIVAIDLVSTDDRRAADLERLEKFLLEQPGVSDPSVVDRWMECAVEGDEQARAELLARLIAAEFKVCAFRLLESDLEDLFLRVTRGEVS